MTSSDLLVIALGNPGPKYENTRHNAGVSVLDELLSRHQARLSAHKRTNTECARLHTPGRTIIAARTRSYMNLSGGPVKALADYFGCSPADLVVLHDELELDLGTVRHRLGGGDKGHNGLKSISSALGTRDYHRVSLGIGRPPGRMDPSVFVLKPFSAKERIELSIMAADAADEVERLATEL
ncbi:aminoacyl-tRNA hydrolase [Corynebacterium tapiri]|uniref:Peptidyl-tRNA hydrolase n=1 Tax=Corynebacterium tapiri TaxID=1448266 RepID=A0A5C4U7X0_9CORY|nr:aminoacyl-tRNA hydrolase [Corynebacterium tapiri]TNM00471.1 aminoacyl-tRNA hydrolase [Corynebacterium tapiri]